MPPSPPERAVFGRFRPLTFSFADEPFWVKIPPAAVSSRGTRRPDGTFRGRLVMRSSSLPMLRGAAWVYVGSLAAIGTVALFALCVSLLTMAVQLVAALLQEITTQL